MPPGRKAAAVAGYRPSRSWYARRELASRSCTTSPSARAIAGARRSAQRNDPKRRCASHIPATEPGTPDARCPTSDSESLTLPSGSRNMSALAAIGAVSRKSSAAVVPSAIRATRNPPPPMFPASGFTTASAKWTATAASTAFPPRRSTSAPISDATRSVVTTIPRAASVGASRSRVNSHPGGNETVSARASAASALGVPHAASAAASRRAM